MGNPNWKKGVSGNPLGRPPKYISIADAVRNIVDPVELAEFVYEIWQDEDGTRSDQERWQAMQWLADRGWGKPVESYKIEARRPEGPAINIALLSVDELQQLRGIVQRLKGGGVAGAIDVGSSDDDDTA